MKMLIKQTFVTQFLRAGKFGSIEIHQRLLNVYSKETVDVNIGDVCDQPRFAHSCPSVIISNEKLLLIVVRKKKSSDSGNVKKLLYPVTCRMVRSLATEPVPLPRFCGNECS